MCCLLPDMSSVNFRWVWLVPGLGSKDGGILDVRCEKWDGILWILQGNHTPNLLGNLRTSLSIDGLSQVQEWWGQSHQFLVCIHYTCTKSGRGFLECEFIQPMVNTWIKIINIESLTIFWFLFLDSTTLDVWTKTKIAPGFIAFTPHTMN